MIEFKNHKVSPGELLKIIPEEQFTGISQMTGVDYYSRVLTGKVLFYLLLCGLLMEDRRGRRGIAGLYGSTAFGKLFNLHLKKSRTARSSLSERLSQVNAAFFKELYGILYHRYSALYPSGKVSGFRLDRGQSSAESFSRMKSHRGLLFAGRLQENRKLHPLREFDLAFKRFQWGELKQDATEYSSSCI